MQAINLVLAEMRTIEGCKEVFLSTDPENVIGKHVYEKVGFIHQNEMWDDEEVYKYIF